MARNLKKGIALLTGGAAILAVGSAGGAVAAGLITSADIKNQTITNTDLAPNSVRFSEMADGAVSWNSLTKGAHRQIESLAGQDGEPATVGLSHWSLGATVPAATEAMPGSIEVQANCQAEGHKAIAGGYTAGTYKGGVTTYLNRNTAGAAGTDEYAEGWLVGFTNTTAAPQKVRTWVVCAEVVEDEPAAPSTEPPTVAAD